MNIQKAIGAGLLVFAFQFSFVSVLNTVVTPFLIQFQAGNFVAYAWQVFIAAVFVAIVYFVARWYFSGNKVDVLHGFYLGVMVTLVNFVINLLQALPFIVYGENVWFQMSDYFKSFGFWVTVILTVFAAMFAGFMGARKKAEACNVENAIGSCMPTNEGDNVTVAESYNNAEQSQTDDTQVDKSEISKENN